MRIGARTYAGSVAGTRLAFVTDYDLPREIVWDALLDADLVGGWLAEAVIEPRLGGPFDLSWVGPTPLAPTRGEITRIDDLEALGIDTSNIGRLLFELHDLPGGTRGGATRLHLTVQTPSEPRFSPNIAAHWRTNLEQLGDLLRGHPVDWANWERDRGETWNAHFDAAAREFSR